MKKRGIFLNKKGRGDIESYFVIIKLIIAFSVIAAMASYVYSVITDTYLEKLYLSRDIAFTTNTIYFAPGNIYHEYVRDKLAKFAVDFSEQKVKMTEEDVKKKEPLYYFYGSDLNYNFYKERVAYSKKITFQKSSGDFEINEMLDKKIDLLRCPNINTVEQGWDQKSFLIDPGHDSRSGFKKGDIDESFIVGSIGLSLYNNDGLKSKKTTKDNLGGDINAQTRKESQAILDSMPRSEVIISLHMANTVNTSNDIKAYVSYNGDEESVKKRAKMGCLIVNELISEGQLYGVFTGGNVIRVNPEYLNEEYGGVLDNTKIAIVLEIGNIQSKRIENLQKPEAREAIAQSIFDGVKKYYEGT